MVDMFFDQGHQRFDVLFSGYKLNILVKQVKGFFTTVFTLVCSFDETHERRDCVFFYYEGGSAVSLHNGALLFQQVPTCIRLSL
jgi:hypothetical protein